MENWLCWTKEFGFSEAFGFEHGIIYEPTVFLMIADGDILFCPMFPHRIIL